MDWEILRYVGWSIPVFMFVMAIAWGVYLRKRVAEMMDAMEDNLWEKFETEIKHEKAMNREIYFDKDKGTKLEVRYETIKTTLDEIKKVIDRIWKVMNEKKS